MTDARCAGQLSQEPEKKYEYRVVWKREGDKRNRYRYYATVAGAERWVDTLKGNYETTDDHRAWIQSVSKPLLDVHIERREVAPTWEVAS